jgi:hypothetical protein
MGEFHISANSGFLGFEKGPSVDVTLQWATYRDASDQTSLSRIWGGIHPPFDDIPGRIVGAECGVDAYHLARDIFYNDLDNDGYLAFEDCDDHNPAIHPGIGELCNGLDDDCDGMVDDSLTVFTWYADADGDGYGNAGVSTGTCVNTAPAGYVALDTDCADDNAAIYPGAAELCDGIDNDCNGLTDDGITYYVYYADADGDGFGDSVASVSTCSDTIPSGYVVLNTDCDDGNAAIYPGAAELCDGIDNDCNGLTDDGITYYIYYADADGDGFGDSVASVSTCADTIPVGYVVLNTDCDDGSAAIYPGAAELCDGVDNDCNGLTDDGITYYVYYSDADGDGFGDSVASVSTCADTLPSGYVVLNTDCDDGNAAIYPGAAELCDGVDNDCNGLTDDGVVYRTYYADTDGDGFGDVFASVLTCADTIPAGYVVLNTDCDDENAAVYPGAAELCDGFDNDCNGFSDDSVNLTIYFFDGDGDGYGNTDSVLLFCLPIDTITSWYVGTPGDCDDSNAAVNPSQTELPGDGLDNDCDGETDNISSATDFSWVVRAYPNPVHDWLNIELPLSGEVRYEILDLNGRLLRDGAAGFTGDILRISFEAELPGVYLLWLQEKSGAAWMVRVVKM